MHIDKLEWVTTIDLKKSIINYFDRKLGTHSDEDYENLKLFYNEQLGSLDDMKKVELTICLNDDAEIMVRMKPKIKEKKLNAFEKALKAKLF